MNATKVCGIQISLGLSEAHGQYTENIQVEGDWDNFKGICYHFVQCFMEGNVKM